eukprot:3432030-Rhodomonas_salina.1
MSGHDWGWPGFITVKFKPYGVCSTSGAGARVVTLCARPVRGTARPLIRDRAGSADGVGETRYRQFRRAVAR